MVSWLTSEAYDELNFLPSSIDFFSSTVPVCHGSTHIEVDITEVQIYGFPKVLSLVFQLNSEKDTGCSIQVRIVDDVPERSSHRPNQSDSLRHSQSERPFNLSFLLDLE